MTVLVSDPYHLV
jgi:hypothetical protein